MFIFKFPGGLPRKIMSEVFQLDDVMVDWKLAGIRSSQIIPGSILRWII